MTKKLLALMTIILLSATAEAIEVSNCTEISSPGHYILTQDLTNSPDTCIQITAGNVIFDGNGHTIDGAGALNSYGVYVYGSTTLRNVTIKNLTVTDWDVGIKFINIENGRIENSTALGNWHGISLSSSNNNSISNNTAYSNYWYGIYLENSDGSTLSNNSVYDNYYGIFLYYSDSNTLSENRASNNNDGIRLISSNNNSLLENTLSSNNHVGISLWHSKGNILSENKVYGENGLYLANSSDNSLYNNLFYNINNFEIRNSKNTWNRAKILGPNIAGGTYLGGNAWLKPDGTGFSQICGDADDDGICDGVYKLDEGNIDYLPLKVNISALAPSQIPAVQTKASAPTPAPQAKGKPVLAGAYVFETMTYDFSRKLEFRDDRISKLRECVECDKRPLLKEVYGKYRQKEFNYSTDVVVLFAPVLDFSYLPVKKEGPFWSKYYDEKGELVGDVKITLTVKKGSEVVFSVGDKNYTSAVIMVGGGTFSLSSNRTELMSLYEYRYRIIKNLEPGNYTAEVMLKDRISGIEARGLTNFTVKSLKAESETKGNAKGKAPLDALIDAILERMRQFLEFIASFVASFFQSGKSNYIKEMLARIGEVRGYEAEVVSETADPDLNLSSKANWTLKVDRANKRMLVEMQGQQMFMLDKQIYFKDTNWKKSRLSEEQFDLLWWDKDVLSRLKEINVSEFRLVDENAGYAVYKAEKTVHRIKEKGEIRIESYGNTTIEIWVDKNTKLPKKLVTVTNATHFFYENDEKNVRRMMTKQTVEFTRFDQVTIELPEEAKKAEESAEVRRLVEMMVETVRRGKGLG